MVDLDRTKSHVPVEVDPRNTGIPAYHLVHQRKMSQYKTLGLKTPMDACGCDSFEGTWVFKPLSK